MGRLSEAEACRRDEPRVASGKCRPKFPKGEPSTIGGGFPFVVRFDLRTLSDNARLVRNGIVYISQ
jgi:hypothetical protein